jgi:maleylpyruvate isomerase
VIPYEDLVGAREATYRLLEHLDDVGPGVLGEPSRLPGWTRAHVVAHLAGNVESHVRMLDGCLAGEVREQYEGGREAREAAIDALAADAAAAVAEHRAACAALESRWDRMRPEHWARDVLRLDRGPEPGVGLAWARWREVELHRVDLGLGYEPAAWDPRFAVRLREELLDRTGLHDVVRERVRGSDAAVAAWLSGRSDGADLDVLGSGTLPVPPAWA